MPTTPMKEFIDGYRNEAAKAAEDVGTHGGFQRKALLMRKWYLGSLNDGLFIIDTPPQPSTDYAWHDRPDGPEIGRAHV